MPEKEFQILSKKEAIKLLEYFNRETCLKIDNKVSSGILNSILKLHLRSNIIEVYLPEGANIKNDCFHVSLRTEGKQQLQDFLKK